MTPSILTAAQEGLRLAEKATKGPWELWQDPYSKHRYVWSPTESAKSYGGICSCIQDEQDGNGPKELADGNFIAHCGTHYADICRAYLVDRAELAKQVDRNAEYLHNLKRLRGAKEAAEAQLAECQKERDEAKRHIYLASGFAMRSGRELEIATALEETPESDRDSADNTIGELLDMIDAGRSVVSRLTAEVERLREDKERLDWLDGMNKDTTFGIYPDARDGNWSIIGNPTDSYSGGIHLGDGATLRAAIDAAMSNPEKQ